MEPRAAAAAAARTGAGPGRLDAARPEPPGLGRLADELDDHPSESGRAVAWRTRESGATWTYELDELPGGTRLTGRRDLPAFTLGTTVLGPVIGGAAAHDQELSAGLATTLGLIKDAVEHG